MLLLRTFPYLSFFLSFFPSFYQCKRLFTCTDACPVLKYDLNLHVISVGSEGSLVVICVAVVTGYRVAVIAVSAVICAVPVNVVKGNLAVDVSTGRRVVPRVPGGVVAAVRVVGVVVAGDADAVDGTDPAFVEYIK